MKIRIERLNELFELFDKRNEYSTEGMEQFDDKARSLAAYEKAFAIDKEIEAKETEIAREEDIATAFFVVRLMTAIYPVKSRSRVLKCLEVCGVEVISNAC